MKSGQVNFQTCMLCLFCILYYTGSNSRCVSIHVSHLWHAGCGGRYWQHGGDCDDDGGDDGDGDGDGDRVWCMYDMWTGKQAGGHVTGM